MTVHLDNKSTKIVLLTIAALLEKLATDNRYKRRGDAALAVSKQIRKVAVGRAVSTLYLLPVSRYVE